MQRTRLNTLASVAGDRLNVFFNNPWRRFSLLSISLFVGLFVGETVSTTAGQTAQWDVVAAGLLVGFTELVNIFVYRDRTRRNVDNVLNLFKVGVVYSLFLEAFKLGS
ncbi:MAG: hypothetical protein N5P05_002890 [Chroococcopsis gigantea SAG 12.99]|jgi:hypothetical protein|nr:DUF565 domain-containing protein [Chlorogloea purpurea SAG 13.99]MDV3001284.1 hypothetical protein [Chroococcopsis gigantea SAG 12.99]